MLDELRAQRHCALLAGDDKNAINALERMNDAYYLLNEPDSVIRYCLRASQLYQQYDFQEEAAQALGPAIDELVKKGDFEQAKTLIDRYSTSKKHFVNGELIPRKAQHYYTKSLYYMGVGKLDSAEIMLRKLIFHPERTDPQLEAGYRGMLKLYGARLARQTHRGQAPLCSAGYAQDGASPRVSVLSDIDSQLKWPLTRIMCNRYRLSINSRACRN
jgi:tetratricopeptide (TPR) repeat protein